MVKTHQVFNLPYIAHNTKIPVPQIWLFVCYIDNIHYKEYKLFVLVNNL